MTDSYLLRRRSGLPRRSVTLGSWTLELRGAELADIAFDGVPLLRAIRPVVRDRDWNTVPSTVANVDDRPDGLAVALSFDDGTVRFTGSLDLTLTAGELRVDFEAISRGENHCNRVGLVVLHHPTVAGSAVLVRHSDGSSEPSAWPVDISPHQPFVDVSGFSWTDHGLAAALTLTGDVFETEDQRNWTDASFKTYSTPLSRPFPVAYGDGDTISQAASVRVSGTPLAIAEWVDPDLVVISGEIVGRVPAIGVAAALFPPPDGPSHLTAGRFESVLVELTDDPGGWPRLLTAAAAQAEQLDCGLDVRLVTDDSALVAQMVATLPAAVIRLSAFDPLGHITTRPLWGALSAVRDPAIEVVAGTRAHFTELNRRIDDLPGDASAYTFSLTPQMHATEVDHIIESLAMQRLVAANARRLVSGRRLHVGPVTLTRRFNAVATSGPRSAEDSARDAVDPLLHTEFAATWTLASLAALSCAGIATVCYFELAGPRGLQVDDQLTPVGRFLDHSLGLRGRTVLGAEAAADLAVLAVATDAGTEVMIGNLSGRARTVGIVPPDGRHRTAALDPWGSTRFQL